MTGEVAKVVGVSQETVKKWCEAGLVRPCIPAGGSGVHRRLSIVPDTLAVAVGRALRRWGLPLEIAGAAMKMLMHFSEEGLLREFAAGNTCLVISGERVLDRLIGRNDVFLRTAEPEADAVLPFGLDVQKLYEVVCAKIAALN